MTKVYYCTTHRDDEYKALKATRAETLLVSFALWQNKPLKLLVDELGYRPKSIILDPGAVTFDKYNIDTGVGEIWHFFGAESYSVEEVARILLEESLIDLVNPYPFHKYVKYYLDNREYVDHVLAFDRMGHGASSFYSYEVLKHMGLNPVAVFHYRNDFSYLDKYVAEGNDLIALGGILKEPKITERIKWINECRQRYPAQKFHVLGTQSRMIIKATEGVYSCDGNAWKITAGYTKNRKPGQTKVEKSIELINELEKFAQL